MLKDLEKRITHWDANHLAYQQGDSIKVPFENYKSFFVDKDVLEIGPGEGRQYEEILNFLNSLKLASTKSYSIADISQKVLDESLYNSIKGKYLIKSYLDRFEAKFDVIHFWYVLHHVLPEELNVFIDFLYAHLNDKGIIMFNTPYLDYDAGNYTPNGIKTTEFTIGDVENAFKGKFEFVVRDKSLWKNSNGYVVIGRKSKQ